MSWRPSRLFSTALVVALLLVAIFALVLLRFRGQLRDEIRQAIIDRHAAVLRPVALRQLAQREASATSAANLLAAVLESAQQEDMLGVVVFDAQGKTIDFAPASLLFAELPLDDYLRLLKQESIGRYHASFPLGRYFAGVDVKSSATVVPVLEVLLPLHARNPEQVLGFAQYYIDARALAVELAAIDQRVQRQTNLTLAMGSLLIALVVAVSYLSLNRAQRVIAERNQRLVRANFELSLSAKASAVGQITSHLIHGLQGSVAGLRSVVAARSPELGSSPDWATAADYTEQMQTMIQETVALLSDRETYPSYQLDGYELAEIIRQRASLAAQKKNVAVRVDGTFSGRIDNHLGGLICLIVTNLLQNAIEATPSGREVRVHFEDGGQHVAVLVEDEGEGIPAEMREHLFEPGRSGRSGGTGLGLAISQLLARQIGASLILVKTDTRGTTFSLSFSLRD